MLDNSGTAELLFQVCLWNLVRTARPHSQHRQRTGGRGSGFGCWTIRGASGRWLTRFGSSCCRSSGDRAASPPLTRRASWGSATVLPRITCGSWPSTGSSSGRPARTTGSGPGAWSPRRSATRGSRRSQAARPRSPCTSRLPQNGPWRTSWTGRTAGRAGRLARAAGLGRSTVYLTEHELAGLVAAFEKLIGDYTDQRPLDDLASRPPGSVPVDFSLFVVPREPTSGGH